MKKFFLATLVLSILLAFVGCRSTNQTLTELGGKYEVIQVSDTGFVGHDNSGFVVLQKQSSTASQVSPSSVQPQKAIEVTTYESSSLTWTGCPDKGWKPNRRAKNIKRTEERKKWTTERDIQPTPPPVVHQERVAIPIAVYGGGNASVGNSLLPSIATAGGIIGGAAVLRPSETNVSTNASGGTGTGGAGGSGGAGGAGGSGAAAAAAATTSTSTGPGGAASGGSGAAAAAGN